VDTTRKWNGATELEAQLVALDTITLDKDNARTHGENNLVAINRSLARFGQRKPVVVRGGAVVAGNGTVMAARMLGWTHIAAVMADDLSEEEARAYGLADNQTTLLSEWGTKLADVYASLPRELRPFTGFSDKAVQGAVKAAQARAAGVKVVVFTASEEQAAVIREAIDTLKKREGFDITDGRALELIAADFMSGASF